MAQIDLKNCDIYLEDGYANAVIGPTAVNQATASSSGGSPLVNLMGGYMAGATTMLVDGITGAVSNNERFTIVGSSLEYKITGHVETLGATTSITFTPALDASIADDAPITFLTGYGVGATTMLVDGSTGAAAIGDRFQVAGNDSVSHVVTAHSETLGNTTSITFTPALAGSVLDNAAITWYNHQLKIKVGEGNMQWTEKRMITYTKDRGKLDTVKLGDEEPVEVKLDFTWVFLKGDTADPPTIEDVLKHRGAAVGWVSSSSDGCEPYAINIVVVYTPPCSVKKEVYNLHDFRYEDLGHDIKTGQVAVSGKCNVTEPVVSRVTTYT